MKIAIQGHLGRGKEIIKILESLGGKNGNCEGTCSRMYYFIDGRGYISCDYDDICLDNGYKLYTLEEFEKEFPFRIGDKVEYMSSVGIIKEYCYIDYKPGYMVSSELIGGKTRLLAKELKPYKEMKTRTIELSLETAKAWYKQGGTLKEVALQAFNEVELGALPKTWPEFVAQSNFDFTGVMCYENGLLNHSNSCISDKTIDESSKIWNKYIALFQLEQLRDCYRQGWIPNWHIKNQKYTIVITKGEPVVSSLQNTNRFLSFQSVELAEKFLNNFIHLIKQAGDLI